MFQVVDTIQDMHNKTITIETNHDQNEAASGANPSSRFQDFHLLGLSAFPILASPFFILLLACHMPLLTDSMVDRWPVLETLFSHVLFMLIAPPINVIPYPTEPQHKKKRAFLLVLGNSVFSSAGSCRPHSHQTRRQCREKREIGWLRMIDFRQN
jgi:hypothetical protein